MATMESQIRTALKLLTTYDNVKLGDLSLKRIGAMTIETLLAEGLAYESRSASGARIFAITEKGKAMAEAGGRRKLTSWRPLD